MMHRVLAGLVIAVSAVVVPLHVTAAAAIDCEGATATIVGTDSNDLLSGNGSANVVHGKAGDDTLSGRGGDDYVCGGEGNDSVNGDAWYAGGWNYPSIDGGDVVQGGPGCDYLATHKLRDILFGGSGNDLPPIYGGCQTAGPTWFPGGLDGGNADDNHWGNTGWDYLYGGSGDDWGDGGADTDRCSSSTLEIGLSCEIWV